MNENQKPGVAPGKAETLADLLRIPVEGQETAFEVIRQADPEGTALKTTLAIQRRQLSPEVPPPPVAPPKAESPARAHEFHDVDGFAAYLAKYRTQDTVILANAQAGLISAVLDEAAPKGRETLTLRPATHPLFLPWEGVLGKKILVLAFSRFIMENRGSIARPDGYLLALTFSQLTASTKITMNKGVGRKSINGVMIDVEIQGTTKQEAVDLPDDLEVEVPLYLGTPALPIQIDLLVFADHEAEDIFVVATAGRVLEARTNAFLAMVDQLRQALPEAVVALGSPQTRPWEYLIDDE
jgi:hypothetical protein